MNYVERKWHTVKDEWPSKVRIKLKHHATEATHSTCWGGGGGGGGGGVLALLLRALSSPSLFIHGIYTSGIINKIIIIINVI